MLKICVLASVAATAFAQPEITSSNGGITLETVNGVNVARRQEVSATHCLCQVWHTHKRF